MVPCCKITTEISLHRKRDLVQDWHLITRKNLEVANAFIKTSVLDIENNQGAGPRFVPGLPGTSFNYCECARPGNTLSYKDWLPMLHLRKAMSSIFLPPPLQPALSPKAPGGLKLCHSQRCYLGNAKGPLRCYLRAQGRAAPLQPCSAALSTDSALPARLPAASLGIFQMLLSPFFSFLFLKPTALY